MKAKLDEGDDEGSGDDENSGDDEEEDSSDGSDIELVSGKVKPKVKPVASAVRKGHPNVAASHGAQKNLKRKLQVIEEESSDDETGESVCCIRILCWILKLIDRSLRHDIRDQRQS
jgi:hypothetical protein